MTLNIATAPDEIKTYNHNKYFLLDNNSAVLVNGLSTTIVLFPVKLLLSSESVSISSAQITPEIGFKNVVLGPDYKPQPPSEDEFIDLLNYITKDPTGIAEKSIIDAGGNMLKYGHEEVKSNRFEVTAGNRYSLNNAFKYNLIQNPVSEVLADIRRNCRLGPQVSHSVMQPRRW